MASIVKRGKKWQARISWYDDENKRHFKTKSNFPTKKLAQIWAADNENKLNKGIDIEKSVVFTDYYDQWVETYKSPKVADVTLARYYITSGALKSFFGKTKIKEITRDTYQQFINEYGATHASHTVKMVNGIVRACVRSAILDDYLIKDFTQGVELISNPDKTLKVEYLSKKEIEALLKAAVENDDKSMYASRYMIATAIYTGMRLSEIQALTWNDINWLKQTISITKSWDANKHDFKPTKNKSSVRTIKVNQNLLNLLSRLRQRHISNMVFMTQFGNIPTSNAVNKVLKKLLSQLKIHKEGFHFHSLRHSHVALLLADGVDIYAISKRLGHSEISTTTNTYAYLIDEYKNKTDEEIINALEKLEI